MFCHCLFRHKIDERTKTIEREMRVEERQLRRQVKILLLGSGESGKSTFLKQMIIIHGENEFTADEVRVYRRQIYQNIVSAMYTLLDARQKLGFAWEKQDNQQLAEWISHRTVKSVVRDIDQQKFGEIGDLIRELWDDDSVRRTYDRRNLFQIVVYEDRHTNRIAESLSIFETIVNHKSFAHLSIILFMNKSDLVEEKVPKSDIRLFHPDFAGDPVNVADVQFFILNKFESCRINRDRAFFYHFTTAIDTENIRRVFKSCRDTILRRNLRALSMM